MLNSVKIPITLYFALIAGALSMFLEFSVEPFFGQLHTVEEKVPLYMWHFILGAVAVFFVVVGLLFDLHEKNMAKAEHLEKKIRNLADSGEKIEYMGAASQLIDNHHSLLMSLADDSIRVKNTLAFFSRSGSNSALPFGPEQMNKRRQILEKVLSQHRSWTDLYSEKTEPAIDDETKWLLKAYSSAYSPHILRSSYPVVNFILFINDEHMEVWFGFGLFSGYDGPVFRSADPNLCMYFDKYFDALMSDSRKWDEVGREDLQGSWISVSYLDGKINDIAVVWIEMVDSSIHPLYVKGNVFAVANEEFHWFRKFSSTSAGFTVRQIEAEAVLDFTFDDQDLRTKVTHKSAGHYSYSDLDYFEGTVFGEARETKKIYGGRWKGKDEQIGKKDADQQRKLLKQIYQEGCIRSSQPAPGERALPKSFFKRQPPAAAA